MPILWGMFFAAFFQVSIDLFFYGIVFFLGEKQAKKIAGNTDGDESYSGFFIGCFVMFLFFLCGIVSAIVWSVYS